MRADVAGGTSGKKYSVGFSGRENILRKSKERSPRTHFRSLINGYFKKSPFKKIAVFIKSICYKERGQRKETGRKQSSKVLKPGLTNSVSKILHSQLTHAGDQLTSYLDGPLCPTALVSKGCTRESGSMNN